MNVELDGATRLLFQATADGQAEPTPAGWKCPRGDDGQRVHSCPAPVKPSGIPHGGKRLQECKATPPALGAAEGEKLI